MTHQHLLEGAGPQLPLDLAQPHQHEAAQQSNIYRIAWQRKSLLILGLVLGVVIGLLYYSQKDPAYQSTAIIEISRKNPPVFGESDRRDAYNNSDDYVARFATRLHTQSILERVAQDQDIRRLPTFEGKNAGEIISTLMTSMIVNRDTRDPNVRTPILQITFKGPVQNDCQTVIKGVIKAFKDYLEASNASSGSQVLETIKKAETTMKQEYEGLIKKHNKFREENPAILSNKEKNPMWARLEMLEGARQELQKHLYDVQSRLEAINKGGKEGLGMALMYLMPGSPLLRNNNADNPLSMVNTSEKLMNLQLLEKELSGRLGKNHPEYKQVQAQIEAMHALLNQQAKAINDNNAAASSESPVKTMMNAFHLDAERVRDLIKKYDDEIAKDKQRLKEMGQLVLQDQEFESKKEMLQKTLISLAGQINATTAIKETPIYVAETIQDPTAPVKVEPRFFVIITLSTILGLLGGFALAYLADMTDKSFRSPEEIRRRLNIPVVGHVPTLISEEEAAKLEGAINGPDPILVTYYRPKSRKAEVFRGIRTALYFNTRGEGHKVIQVTSPNMGDGKTTLVSNLAVSIAQSGKQTILIDADFRRPRLHKIFAVPSEKGFASVIMGQCDLRDAIQPTVVPGLSVLPCGPIPPNPAELLTSPRFKELMDELREQYDYVLVDTPPLLVVTDPCVVAPRVDGVLMTMRVVKNGRPVAERARDILVSLGAKPLGVVVNGVSMAGSGGYGYGYEYGQYDYSQAYQYKYEYSDRYYSGYADEGYYQDRDATEVTPPIPREANPVNRLSSEPSEPTPK